MNNFCSKADGHSAVQKTSFIEPILYFVHKTSSLESTLKQCLCN